MRTIRMGMFRAYGVSMLLAAAPLVGCSGTAATEPPVVTATGGTTAPLATPVHGRAKQIAEALAEVPLRPDQRAQIEQMATEAEARHSAVRSAHNVVMLALADQIAAGAIDRTALQPKLDAATAAMLQARPKDHAAFEQLHALLDTTQRSAFVDAFEARGQAMRAAHAGGHGDRLATWAADLKLTDAQQDQIRAALKDQFMAHKAEAVGARGEWKEAHQHGKQMLEGFRADHFAMADYGPPPDLASTADKMTDHFVHLAEVVLPLLTPEQRTLAAAKLRARAADANAEMEP